MFRPFGHFQEHLPHTARKSLRHYSNYRGAEKSLAQPGRIQARKHIRDARDFNKIETRAVIEYLFLRHKAPKEIHAILT